MNLPTDTKRFTRNRFPSMKEPSINQVQIPSSGQLIRAALLFLLIGLALLSPIALSAQVRLEVRTFKTKEEAWDAAHAYAKTVHALPTNDGGKIGPVFRVPGTRSMSPILNKNNFCVREWMWFGDVQVGDVVCFMPTRNARQIAEYGRPRPIMHPCVGRTKTTVWTNGMMSIDNPHPTPAFDGPTTAANYLGVIKVAFHWEGNK